MDGMTFDVMLATVAVRLFNERAIKISFECAICGKTCESRLVDDLRDPAVDPCECLDDYRRAMPEHFHSDGSLRVLG